MSAQKRMPEGISEGGRSSGKYPKLGLAVQTLPKKATLHPVPGTNLATDDTITFELQVPVDSLVR